MLPVKPEDGCLDLPGHEEQGPSFFVNRLFERGASAVDGYPSIRIRLSREPEESRHMDAFLNQEVARCD